MKTVFILLVSVFLFPVLLPGQSGKENRGYKKRNKSANNKEEFRNPLPPANDSDIIEPQSLPDTLFLRKPYRDMNDFIFRYPGNRFFGDPGVPRAPETYPGAPKFYRKSPQMPSPYEKSFIIPYVASRDQRYFLIIKDPITDRIIN